MLKSDEFLINLFHQCFKHRRIKVFGVFFRVLGNLNHSIDLIAIRKKSFAELEVVDCLPLDKTHEREVCDRRNQVAALSSKAPNLELETMATDRVEIF